MCAIAAIFAYQADAVDASELRRMCDHMWRRGPDAEGEWFERNRRAALGHRRLSIIDLSANGAQPMASGDGRLVISFNGEIYNYRSLREQFERKGCKFRSQSDTEVLLHLYAQKGEDMVHDLRGMYAFAIWDDIKGGLFLARDPFGIKPLYYADDGRTFRAASQVKALLQSRCVSSEADPAAQVGFFLWGHVPEPVTFYRDIRALPAGHSLWVGRDGMQAPKTFCSIPKILAEAEQQAARDSHSEAVECLGRALNDTVRHHLIADVPVGIFLSSGLDSTTLARLATEQTGGIHTVTLGMEHYLGTENDETPLAQETARRLGAKHETIWITRHDFEAGRDDFLAAMDQPTIDGVNTYFVSLAAKRASLKVALSGLGGDELFGGYSSFEQLPRLVKSLAPIAGVRLVGKGLRVISSPILKRFTSPKYAGLFEYGSDYGGAYLLRRGLFMPWELPDVLDPEIVRQGWKDLQPLCQMTETVSQLRSERLKVSCLETCWYMRNQLLRDSDWASMAHSLELRVPLVDVPLLQSVAPHVAGTNPLSKQDMARTPSQPMSDAIFSRPKTGFSFPVREWLLESGEASSAERGLRGWAKVVYSKYMTRTEK